MASPLAMDAGQLMQGPMVGAIDSSSASIWARVAGEKKLSIRYSDHPKFKDSKTTAPIQAMSENDYCVFTKIEGLDPNTYYYYQVLLDGEPLCRQSRKRRVPNPHCSSA
ncbi:MAG: PhoD-like phosphatase N-terminal domain-containing protein [Verrucomicrobiia bacterium]